MSVIMTLRTNGDPSKLERLASDDPERLRSISEKAKQHGVIAHRFYGSEDGEILVIDEWPDRESFESFFQEMQGEIQPLMQEVGASSQPQITFWRKLESNDEIGWGA